MHPRRCRSLIAIIAAALGMTTAVYAQRPPDPEIGYMYPPGGPRGATIDVTLGGYDWTGDTDLFIHDARVTLERLGPQGPLLMPYPPLPIELKAYDPMPLPRETRARLTIPADIPPGPVRWQVANANGASKTGLFIVGDERELLEDEARTTPQQLGSLPVTLSGRLARNEEIDRYTFTAERDGPITVDVSLRRLGSRVSGILEVRDMSNRLLADAVDTAGTDPVVTFRAVAGETYIVSLHELDFRGNRAFTYRMHVAHGPRVLAAIPSVGRPGETRDVEFIGVGLATGENRIETITRSVTFPTAPAASDFDYRLETPFGAAAPIPLSITSHDTQTIRASDSASPFSIAAPTVISGQFGSDNSVHRYRLALKKDERWTIAAIAKTRGPQLDLRLSLAGPDGKEVAAADDQPGTSDPSLVVTAPADGEYLLTVDDVASPHASPTGIYIVSIDQPTPEFALEIPDRLNAPVGSTSELILKVARSEFTGPIAVRFDGLPAGVTVPDNLVIPADQSELKVAIASDSEAPTGAALVTVIGAGEVNGRTITRTATARTGDNLAPRRIADNQIATLLVSRTLPSRTRIWPVESDERTIHRGSTHVAEIGVERLNGFDGPVIVRMESMQPRKFRQGLLSPDVILPPGRDRVFAPCFVPEQSETLDAYRVTLIAVSTVVDPSGRPRELISKMQGDVSVAITVEGSLLKISIPRAPVMLTAGANPTGAAFDIPVTVRRSAKLRTPLRLELVPGDSLQSVLDSHPLTVSAGEEHVSLTAAPRESAPKLTGRHQAIIRAVAEEPGEVPELATTEAATPLDPEFLSLLQNRRLPVIAESEVILDFDNQIAK